MSVQVNKLSKTYGKQQAVHNLSFKLEAGEVLGFLGPNGAGKSTTMKMLTCFVPPTSGSAKICGHDILVEPLEVKKKVGYLPENNPLYYDMYVKEYLEFVAGVYKIPAKAKRTKELIDITGLGLEQHKKIGQLSKGYKQRVGLAQALVHDPEVLILDEPTSGLDPNQLVDIRSLIKTLGEQKTVILSTHIMQEVEAMCSRVMIINHGKVVANDTVEGIRTVQKSRQSVLFKTERPISSFDKVEVSKAKGGLYRASSSQKADLRKVLFDKCSADGNALLHLEEEQLGLEEVFKKVTG